MTAGIYVEIDIEAPMDTIWQLTQEPALHQRWDLRFTGIDYLPRPDESQPQQFLYTTRIGFGLAISGAGESVATRQDEQGRRTSSLRFWSSDPKSLIREGAGYWQYLPRGEGVRFLTWYDYQPRFGLLGRLVDRLIFRPLLGWATAWSFDCLRLWAEAGLEPGLLRRLSLVYALARTTVAGIWLYQGLVPKLLARHPDELTLITAAGLDPGLAQSALLMLGLAETVFGLVLLWRWSARWPLLLTMGLMVAATLGVMLSAPAFLVAAFNPVSLNVALLVLALICYLSDHQRPAAGRCRRHPGRRS